MKNEFNKENINAHLSNASLFFLNKHTQTYFPHHVLSIFATIVVNDGAAANTNEGSNYVYLRPWYA